MLSLQGPSRRKYPRRRAGLMGLCAALLLAACSTTPVVAPSKFPAPVLRKIPVNVALYMDEALRGFVHVDAPSGAATQEVRVGEASQALFTEFLSAQFQTLQTMTTAPGSGSAPAQTQAILQPQIEDVQISSPKSDKDDFHEAWIKYRLLLLTPQGKTITSWELAAYGKHRGDFIGGNHASLTSAVNEAMRDAAAGMALIFKDGDAIRQRIVAANGEPSAPRSTTSANQ